MLIYDLSWSYFSSSQSSCKEKHYFVGSVRLPFDIYRKYNDKLPGKPSRSVKNGTSNLSVITLSQAFELCSSLRRDVFLLFSVI